MRTNWKCPLSQYIKFRLQLPKQTHYLFLFFKMLIRIFGVILAHNFIKFLIWNYYLLVLVNGWGMEIKQNFFFAKIFKPVILPFRGKIAMLFFWYSISFQMNNMILTTKWSCNCTNQYNWKSDNKNYWLNHLLYTNLSCKTPIPHLKLDKNFLQFHDRLNNL